ncbi:Dothistromin biosynthesis peroxidase dotB [Pseudocercospora fuligena]|uniref:Dothistromin biosynthesis peroxidase dotB n=1 Tax=Pseudocercospora fuligena TaxID=685502 RepID=A0A8H6RKX9_9PEZI|nr:Dothistromin biosynthesis peroxidase dotB [Pseudocercospora fuligena]
MKHFIIALLASLAASTPCPYGQLAEEGRLSQEDTAKFFAARSEGESAVQSMIKKREAAEHARQEHYYKRQLSLGDLPLGGGLLGGVLQPFSGVLSALDVPTPQATGLKEIPGDDAAHKYVAPGTTDVRGMCPTLNTMANHGYISHTGITTFAEAANACQITLGFGYDTCTFLSALGLLAGGDLPSGKYSIGGADSRVPNTLGPSLGISKHGFFEVDNSISRIDHAEGNQANFHLDRFNELVNITSKYNNHFGNSAFAEERVLRYNQAKNNNPEFNAGVRWLAVTTAERVFIFRALPNGTEPTNANFANVAPFYMNETFPREWYRRATPYTLEATGADIATLLTSSPELTVPGQNQGLNNFVPLGLDLGNVSPSTATCFLATAIFDETPGFLAPGIADNVDLVNAFLNGAVKPFFSSYNCPVLTFAQPGANATNSEAGVSTNCNVLRNGVYQC